MKQRTVLQIRYLISSIIFLFCYTSYPKISTFQPQKANTDYSFSKNFIMKKNVAIYCVLILLFVSCKKSNDVVDDINEFLLGLNGTDDPSSVPSSITNVGATGQALPASYDLSQYLPPIGNQGQYGTCVAWSTGYYSKTATEAIALNRSAAEINSSANQISPKDLFIAIPDNKKGASDCNGTNFTDALDILQARGAATLQTVPYSNITDCSSANLQSNWTTNAAGHKIEYYRKIDKTVTTIKEQIFNKLPVMFGAKVYSNLQSWNTSDIYSGLSGSYLGNHAITIIGYDDSKGPGGAFKVVNSWGDTWGTAGYIWVDYNFMLNQFSLGDNFYIMANENGTLPPAPPPNTAGIDVAPWAFSDVSTYATSGYINERMIDLNLYNIGNQDLPASADWALYYLYYNAYNANDYGILFYDQFNTTVAAGTYNCPTTYNCNFNYNIPSGSDFASQIFGTSSIVRTYYVPTALNGYYYLVLYADATTVITEQNEQNNIFYTTSQYPKAFSNGYSTKGKTGKSEDDFTNDILPGVQTLKQNKQHSAVNTSTPNAYTPKEILSFLKQQKQSGMLEKKITEFKNSNTNKQGKHPY